MLEGNLHSRDVQDRCRVCCTDHCLIIEMNAEKEVDFIVALSSSTRILRCHVTNNITFGSCVALIRVKCKHWRLSMTTFRCDENPFSNDRLSLAVVINSDS